MTSPEIAGYRLGDAAITKIPEVTLDAIPADYLYPGCDPAVAEAEKRKLDPASIDPTAGLLHLSVHAWLVRTPTRTVLVDTASGNGKTRSGSPAFNQLNEPFLARLKAAGVGPEEVDAVLHTHLHVDHVGWNTQFADGRGWNRKWSGATWDGHPWRLETPHCPAVFCR